MVLTIEPGMEYAPGKMIVHEENIVVREEGAELLSGARRARCGSWTPRSGRASTAEQRQPADRGDDEKAAEQLERAEFLVQHEPRRGDRDDRLDVEQDSDANRVDEPEGSGTRR